MKANPYLNFDGNAEEAFTFYHETLGGELSKMPMSEAPDSEKLPKDEQSRMMHISLKLTDHLIIMASDIFPSMGQKLLIGNNNYISLHPTSKEDADRIFKGLSEGGEIEMPMEDQFWGDYFGSFQDKYGIHWMINYNPEF